MIEVIVIAVVALGLLTVQHLTNKLVIDQLLSDLRAAEDERRLYAAAMMAADHQPQAASILRKNHRAADALERDIIIPEGL